MPRISTERRISGTRLAPNDPATSSIEPGEWLAYKPMYWGGISYLSESPRDRHRCKFHQVGGSDLRNFALMDLGREKPPTGLEFG